MKAFPLRSTAVRAAVALLAIPALGAVHPGAALAAWSGSTRLTAPGEGAVFPTVASNANGTAVVAWYRKVGGGYQIVARLSSNGGRSWGAPQVLGPGLIASGDNPPALVRAAVGSSGRTVVAWQQRVGSGQRVVAAWTTAGRRFSAPRALSGQGVSAYTPDVTVDGLGRAAVVWITVTTVQQALISPAGKITGPRTVATVPRPSEPAVASNSRGQLLLAWIETTPSIPPLGSRTPVVAVRESPNGGLSAANRCRRTAPTNLSPHFPRAGRQRSCGRRSTASRSL